MIPSFETTEARLYTCRSEPNGDAKEYGYIYIPKYDITLEITFHPGGEISKKIFTVNELSKNLFNYIGKSKRVKIEDDVPLTPDCALISSDSFLEGLDMN